MLRLPILTAAVLAVALTAPGCTRNRNLPTQLAPSRTTSIGVNAYLWRAAIDTVSFAPLLQADSNGGVIVTDWYINPRSPSERVKLTVSILDQDLRADALRVAASRQTMQNGVWVNAPVAAATVQKLEDIILTRARDLRRTAVGG
jgi:alpha-beta hydrolase superfamily lysophospholipase